MRKSRFTEAQMVRILREADAAPQRRFAAGLLERLVSLFHGLSPLLP